MTEATVDLMELVDAYLTRTGREINERNRMNVIYTNPAWRKRLPAWKAAQKKQQLNAERPRPTTSAQDTALVNDWLAFRNTQIREYNANLTSGQIGLPSLELGYANGQISMENAIHAAKLWFEERQQEYDDQVIVAG